MQGSFPIDLILFGMVAAFLVLRLRSVLGKRQGFERPPQEAQPPRPAGMLPAERADAARPASAAERLPPAVAGVIARMRAIDPNFDLNAFLAGAEAAFRMIVEAFARGDRPTLRMLLSDEVYAGFDAAITARENARETQRTEIRAVHSITVEAAELRGTVADITVRFVSDQVNLTLAANGDVVAGSDAITELTDLWTFQRDLAQPDPTWKLVATQSL
ncbi:MAG: Tim44/TimA family putative adaptor protein [Rhodovarius sp.]|nr:Tim44/TimA family putative adaptor protein [Rhodovarius sp.]MCX7931315.1 Tim44/TimA family putative adaptor protein [Rhodovarius sp.]MDW8315836.1 Tim44/TimA family putative adaptor protein [Rhodovarius sp.]